MKNLIFTIVGLLVLIMSSTLSAQDYTKRLSIKGDNIEISKTVVIGNARIVVYDRWKANSVDERILKDLEEFFPDAVELKEGSLFLNGEPIGSSTTDVVVELKSQDKNGALTKILKSLIDGNQEVASVKDDLKELGIVGDEIEISTEKFTDNPDSVALDGEKKNVAKKSKMIVVEDVRASQKPQSNIPNVKSRWFLMKIGFNSFIKEGSVPKLEGDVDPTNLKVWPSLHWGIDFFQMRFNLINHYVNLKTGLGIDFNYYEFENNVTLLDRSSSVQWKLEKNLDFRRNNLYTSHLKIPFMLNFESNPAHKSNSFRINAGVYGGLRLTSKLKQKWDNKRLHVKDGFNLSNWTYGLTGSIGYGMFNLYADYSLVGFFKPEANNGYDLTPFNIGIQLIPF